MVSRDWVSLAKILYAFVTVCITRVVHFVSLCSMISSWWGVQTTSSSCNFLFVSLVLHFSFIMLSMPEVAELFRISWTLAALRQDRIHSIARKRRFTLYLPVMISHVTIDKTHFNYRLAVGIFPTLPPFTCQPFLKASHKAFPVYRMYQNSCKVFRIELHKPKQGWTFSYVRASDCFSRLWPSCSPDLSPLCFYSWGNVKPLEY